jgi:hypothetical protein
MRESGRPEEAMREFQASLALLEASRAAEVAS